MIAPKTFPNLVMLPYSTHLPVCSLAAAALVDADKHFLRLVDLSSVAMHNFIMSFLYLLL